MINLFIFKIKLTTNFIYKKKVLTQNQFIYFEIKLNISRKITWLYIYINFKSKL